MATGAAADLDVRHLGYAALASELPGLRAAFDPAAMREQLQAALIGPDARAAAPATVRRCLPTQAILLDDPGGPCCVVRYQLEVALPPGAGGSGDGAGRTLTALVSARLHGTAAGAAGYAAERLAPLAERARGRPELAPFARAAALLKPLAMAVYAFPVDGELPTLVEATDPAVASRALGELLAAAGRLPAPDQVSGCRAEPVHYNRRHRCMLRYRLDLAGGGALTLYGKVSNDGAGERTPAVVAALRGALARSGPRFALPESLGFRPDLQLVVLTEIPGVPMVAQLLKARLRGEQPAPEATGPALEDAVAACGRIAAALHTSGLRLGPGRPLTSELASLRAELASLRRVAPDLGGRLAGWLDLAEERAAASAPLPPCQSHGDFSYTQLIFHGGTSGLVDFDNFCQAEPALDLGHFLAYLRFAGVKAKAQDGSAAERARLVGDLAARFTAAYSAAGGPGAALARVPVYETVSLVRLALHAWQRFKGARLANVLAALDEQART
jgi:hypothetical protein